MKRVLLWILLLISGGSWAACTVSTVNASFGSVSSFALSGTGEVETTGTLVVSCDAVLNLLTNDSITLNYTAASVSGNNRATLKRTDDLTVTDVIPTRLCGLSGCASSSEVQISKAYTWSGNTLLGLLGSKQYNIPLYFARYPGRTLRQGHTRYSSLLASTMTFVQSVRLAFVLSRKPARRRPAFCSI